ncbi:MAG TPA: regulatory protein RecX [Peptococcaceae bacterium]|nr:regulatory protein RecX [Peptococcaceae bacterium]
MKSNFHDSERSALSTALKALSRRQLTTFQLQKRLEEKGFSPETIAEVLERLTEWKYLDDQSYARAYIRSKKEKHSKQRIALELLQAGVSEGLSLKLLDECYPEKQEYENCKILVEKYWKEEELKWERKHKLSSPNQLANKEAMIWKNVRDKLLRKGYLFSTVQAALNNRTERENF